MSHASGGASIHVTRARAWPCRLRDRRSRTRPALRRAAPWRRRCRRAPPTARADASWPSVTFTAPSAPGTKKPLNRSAFQSHGVAGSPTASQLTAPLHATGWLSTSTSPNAHSVSHAGRLAVVRRDHRRERRRDRRLASSARCHCFCCVHLAEARGDRLRRLEPAAGRRSLRRRARCRPPPADRAARGSRRARRRTRCSPAGRRSSPRSSRRRRAGTAPRSAVDEPQRAGRRRGHARRRSRRRRRSARSPATSRRLDLHRVQRHHPAGAALAGPA